MKRRWMRGKTKVSWKVQSDTEYMLVLEASRVTNESLVSN